MRRRSWLPRIGTLAVAGMVLPGTFLLFTVHACGARVQKSTNAGAIAPDGVAPTPGDDKDSEPSTEPTVSSSKANVTQEEVSIAGGLRRYVLEVPKTYNVTRTYPLIVALHGDGQSADSFRAFLRLDEICGGDAIAAYPDQVLDLFTPYDQNPDQRLVEAVIVAVQEKYSVDSSKVWGFGYSKGGFMVNEIACRKPGLLKAIAGHASGAPQEPRGADGFPQCRGVIGLPVMTSEGNRDRDIGADYAANYWASINGCSANRVPSSPAGCESHTGCSTGNPVVFCLAAGVSHYPIWSEAARVSWAFFTAL